MRCLTIVATAAAAFLAATPRAGAEEPATAYRTVEIASGHFRCEVPQAWHFDRQEREEARIHYHGFYTYGPKGDEGIGPALSVRYFAPDNTLFPGGAQEYFDRQLKPGIIQLAREKTSPPRDVTVAGRPAKTFTRDTFEYFPPESIDMKEIPVREEHTVVPHLGGFVIVRFEAPTKSYPESRKTLERALASLRLFPETTFQTLRLSAPGLTAEAVEARVTNPVEAALADMPGLQETWSASSRGESLIVLAFDATADSKSFRAEIRRRLTPLRADLPPRTHVAYDPALPAGEPALSVTVSTSGTPSTNNAGFTNSPAEERPAAIARLSALTERTIRSRIAAVPGVAEATPIGARPRYEMILSAERFKDDVDIRDLIAAVRHEPTPAGTAVNDLSIDDLARRVVASRNGRDITVGDLAEMRLAVTEPAAAGRRLAESEAGERAVGVVIRTAPELDSGSVIRAVEQLLREIRPTLPPGVILEDRRTPRTTNPVLEMLGISREHFVLKVTGGDLTMLENTAEEVRNRLAKIDGIADLTVVPIGRPALHVAIRRDEAARYGFDEKAIGEISDVVNTIVERRAVGRVVGPHGLPVDVVVRTARDEPLALRELIFSTPEGPTVPLAAIADVSFADEPAAVLHAGGGRVVLLAGRISADDRECVEREIRSSLEAVRLPAGYSIGRLGKDETR